MFHLNDGDLYYNDVRQFGWIKVVKSESSTENNFAPEPFRDLTLEYFQKLLTKSKRNIKVLLMDQSKIGGVGNIYANDALWESRISPKRIASSLTTDEQQKLYDSIHAVLKSGLKYGGASELAFVTPDGKEGEYQNHTLVYGHEKTLCDNCKNLLQNNKCDIHVCMECGDISEIIVNNSLEEATYLFDSVCNWCYALKYSNIKCRKSHFYNYTNPFIKEPNYAH